MPTPLYWRLILMAALPTALFAQWPAYTTPGVPKTPDGKPNLSAPAPKTPDGKPDLTGIWETSRAPARAAAPNPKTIFLDDQSESIMRPAFMRSRTKNAP